MARVRLLYSSVTRKRSPMSKVLTKRLNRKSPGKAKPRKTKVAKRKSLSELDVWLTANHNTLMDKARRNCMRLTGKQTFAVEGSA